MLNLKTCKIYSYNDISWSCPWRWTTYVFPEAAQELAGENDPCILFLVIWEYASCSSIGRLRIFLGWGVIQKCSFPSLLVSSLSSLTNIINGCVCGSSWSNVIRIIKFLRFLCLKKKKNSMWIILNQASCDSGWSLKTVPVRISMKGLLEP